MQLGEALAIEAYEGTKIVTVGMVSGGFILTGKRRDNGKWTSPGGHVDPGEDMITAAQREVREEAGIEVAVAQLEFIAAAKVDKGRGGFPFMVIAFLAHVEREKATAKFDPDKEISEWKWVDISKSTPELQEENRHAYEDTILVHLGVNRPKEARMAKLTMEEQSKKIRNANFDESPPAPKKSETPASKGTITATPAVPEPGAKTPADMKNNPDSYLPDSEVTGETDPNQKDGARLARMSLQDEFKKKHPYSSGDKVRSAGHTRVEALTMCKQLRDDGIYASIWHQSGPESGPKSRYFLCS